MQHITKRLSIWAVIVALVLLIPLALTLLGSGVDGDGLHWTLGDFIFAFILMFGSGATYELVAKKMNNTAYKLAVGLAVATGFILLWTNAAVGIISDGDLDGPEGMYAGVLAVGIIGCCIARFQALGMARALFITAIAQALVPIIALIIRTSDFTPDLLRLFILNTFFVVLWAVSGLLFRRANATGLNKDTDLTSGAND